MKKAALLSIGCKTNQYEIEALKEELVTIGFDITDYDKNADVYIVNTCAVTAEAVRKSKQMIRRAQGNNALICVMGCFSELNMDETGVLDDVYIIAGTNNRSEIISILKKRNFVKEKKYIISKKDTYEDLRISSFSNKTRAYIKIEDGCDSYCSFCIIPYARGPIKSRDIKEIVAEANRLVLNGFSEIVLTGINICKYDYEKNGLIEVLYELDAIERIDRIRLGSIYPDFLSTDIVTALSKIKKLCHHFHISLQSGSTKILNKMNRKYTAKEAVQNLKYLIEKMDDVVLTADIIVGFPSESDEDFEDTVNFIEQLPFYHTHVFKYSIRQGTKAASMKGQINNQLKKDRSKKLIELSSAKKKKEIEKYIGKKLFCLFESENKKNIKEYYGHTDNFIDVICMGDDLEGQRHEVRIIAYEDGYARAELIC